MKIYVAASKNDKKTDLVDGELREYKYVEDCQLDNSIYCELTVLHDIWKNSNEDIVGLEHYRRFFVDKPYDANDHKEDFNILGKERIDEIMKDYDIILSRNFVFTNILSWKYKELHNPNVKTKPLIRELLYLWDMFLRDKKSIAVDKINLFEMNVQWYYACNMFIGKKEVIDKYCEWLFPLLEEFGKKYKTQPRLYGFLSEYMMGYWMLENKYKIYDTPKITYEKDLKSLSKYQYNEDEWMKRKKEKIEMIEKLKKENENNP